MIIEILILLHLISKFRKSSIWFCWYFQNFFIEFQKMNFEHASMQRSNFNDETSFSAINITWKNQTEVSSTTKESLEENEVSSTETEKQKNLKKTSESTRKTSNKNAKKIEKQQNLINFLFVQLIYFQMLNNVLFQLLKHEILYHSTSDQKYMMKSMSNSDSEFQVKKCLIAEKWEAFLIFMTKFTWFLSSQSHVSMKIQSIICYVVSFFMLRTSETLYFAESNVIKFVECFENLKKNHEISKQWITEVVLCYCKQKIWNIIKAQNVWKLQNWKKLKTKMRELYQSWNSYQMIYLKLYLKVFILKECHTISELKEFCLKFKVISDTLIIQKVLNEHMRCIWFLKELSVLWQQKILSKQNIDVLNFTIMNFKQIYNIAWAKLQLNKQRKFIDEIMWFDLH